MTCATCSSAPVTGRAQHCGRDALAATHAALLHELAGLRASEALALAQADAEVRANYLATNRAALLAEHDRLRAQLAQLAPQAAV